MISLSDFRVVYEGKVLNAIALEGYEAAPESYGEEGNPIGGMYRIERMSIIILDIDGTFKLVWDKASKFQFLSKVRE